MNKQVGEIPLDGVEIAELRVACIEPLDEQRDTILETMEGAVIGL